MRLVAKRMREKAEELSEEIVDVRKEDRTIKDFTIPAQPDLVGEVIKIDSYSLLDPRRISRSSAPARSLLRKKTHLLLAGPMHREVDSARKIVNGADGVTITEGIRVATIARISRLMDFNDTVYQSLEKIVRATKAA